MNYVSFSLWGDNPFYNLGAIRNAELMSDIYPEWKMVLYYDNTVPNETIQKLIDLNVMVIDATKYKLYGMFWRFLASELPDCERVVFRDADSRISKREKLAVDEWVKNDTVLHVMRDHPAHGIPYGNNELGILGGMWGIKGQILPMRKMIDDFCKGQILPYGSDQAFLKNIYRVFLGNRTTHDPFFEKKDFPTKRENYRFIGERIDINENPLTNDHLVLKNYNS